MAKLVLDKQFKMLNKQKLLALGWETVGQRASTNPVIQQFAPQYRAWCKTRCSNAKLCDFKPMLDDTKKLIYYKSEFTEMGYRSTTYPLFPGKAELSCSCGVWLIEPEGGFPDGKDKALSRKRSKTKGNVG